MSITYAKLGEIAPAKAARGLANGDALVWHLNLDQIESGSGRIIDEVMLPVSKAGNSTHWFDETNVLYSKLRPYLNKVVVPKKAGVATTELVPLQPDPKRLDRRYLAYYLRSDQFVNWVNIQVAGAKMPRVSMKVFWDHEIPLPPLPEQRRIAAILDKADAIRRKRQEAIRLTEDFLRSVFLDMFGDPVTNPKSWEVKPIGETTFIDAPMVDPRERKYQDLLHIGPDRIEKSSGRLLPAKSAKEDNLISGKFLFDDRHVLYSKIRPLLRKVALPSFSGLCSADVYPVRPNDKYMTKEFIWYVLLSDSFLNYTQTLSSRANIPKINRKEFSAYPCYLPPLPLQKEFSKRLQATRNMNNKLNENEEGTENLFNSLVQRAFRGDL